MKERLPYYILAGLLLFYSNTSQGQICEHSFQWLNQSHQDTLNFNDSLTFSFKLRFNGTYPCNATTYNDVLRFNFQAIKSFTYHGAGCIGSPYYLNYQTKDF